MLSILFVIVCVDIFSVTKSQFRLKSITANLVKW